MATDGLGAGMVLSQYAIELQQVWLGWRDRIALRDISGGFVPGSLTAVVGPNGLVSQL